MEVHVVPAVLKKVIISFASNQEYLGKRYTLSDQTQYFLTRSGTFEWPLFHYNIPIVHRWPPDFSISVLIDRDPSLVHCSSSAIAPSFHLHSFEYQPASTSERSREIISTADLGNNENINRWLPWKLFKETTMLLKNKKYYQRWRWHRAINCLNTVNAV